MTDGIRSGFADTARGKIHFEVSGPEGAPALMLLTMPTTKGAMPEMGHAYQRASDQIFASCSATIRQEPVTASDATIHRR